MTYSPYEIMVVSAARFLKNDDVCFVGIGAPSAACNLAKLTSAPNITLIYESGTINTAPKVLPLSIGDGELCSTALTTVSGVEMFNYWLQGGRITVGFLGAAQLDRFGNINTTVIGNYNKPKVRLPGGGGAPEIASHSKQVYIIMKQSPRSFVSKIDFFTSYGFGKGGSERIDKGITTKGPQLLITDKAIWKPTPQSNELQVVALYPGVTREEMQDTVGWPIKYAKNLEEYVPPSKHELEVLRDLQERTKLAHGKKESN